MADNRTPVERRRNMSSVRNKGSRAELDLLALIKAERLGGWRRNYKKVYGTPDLAYPALRLAIFVDGCFWHGCSCKTVPQTNTVFWSNKISVNMERDILVNRKLLSGGWTVWRIKEHELKRVNLEKIRRELILRIGQL